MTIKMADTGGSERDVKVGSEMRGDKIAVCAVQYSCSQVMFSAKISGKN